MLQIAVYITCFLILNKIEISRYQIDLYRKLKSCGTIMSPNVH